MAVQQGQLSPTDTTKNMENYYSDSIVTTVAGADRSIHNGTQFVRLALQRAQAVTATAFTASGSQNIDSPEYIDSSFVAYSTTGVSQITISFGALVATTSVVVYSQTAIDTNTSNWTVQTSLNNSESEFSDANFDAAVTAVTSTIIAQGDAEIPGATDDQIKYTLTVTAPLIDTTNIGLKHWRVKHSTADILDGVTEVQIIQPLTPAISYFDTDGSLASTFTFEKPDILDAVYDNVNDVFYTIRFNDQTTGTATVSGNDGFTDGEAGTASGTTDFNPGRWIESSTNTALLRTGDELVYNVATGAGQLETTFTLGNFTTTLEVAPQAALSSEEMWLVMRALDTDNKSLIQEGIGFEQSPTTSGVFFASALENFTDNTSACTLKDVRPLWHNAASGTESFEIAFNGAVWTVTGTEIGELTDAQTGVSYNESTDATTPLEFLISCTATPANGENFTFDITTENVKKTPIATGTLGISRTGSDFTTNNTFTVAKTINADVVNIELYGNTDGSVNLTADTFELSSGAATFPDVNVFTVERTDSEGDLTGSPTVIEAFDIIGDPSKTYNSFLDGRVQITATQSGTGGGFIYIKVDDTLYKYANNVSLSSDDGIVGVTATSQGQIPKDGTHSLAWTRESGVGGLPFLTYHEFESAINIIHLRTLDKDSLLNTTDTKEILLNQSTYSTVNNFKVFYDQNDFDTLYYVDSSTNLQSFNIDDRISAFMAVNAEDVTLPAGTSQQTFVNADVINAWGEVLSGKVVTFQVSSGDGAVSPPSDTTVVVTGRATTQFTVGSTVGVSTVTATVTEA